MQSDRLRHSLLTVFVNTYRVAASDKAEFFAKLTILIPIKFVFTKTIRLLALNFYGAIVNSGFALFNYHLIEISSS